MLTTGDKTGCLINKYIHKWESRWGSTWCFNTANLQTPIPRQISPAVKLAGWHKLTNDLTTLVRLFENRLSHRSWAWASSAQERRQWRLAAFSVYFKTQCWSLQCYVISDLRVNAYSLYFGADWPNADPGARLVCSNGCVAASLFSS